MARAKSMLRVARELAPVVAGRQASILGINHRERRHADRLALLEELHNANLIRQLAHAVVVPSAALDGGGDKVRAQSDLALDDVDASHAGDRPEAKLSARQHLDDRLSRFPAVGEEA